jgi:hypothetical protein
MTERMNDRSNEMEPSMLSLVEKDFELIGKFEQSLVSLLETFGSN